VFSKVVYHTFPRICPESEAFNVKVNEKETPVYYTSAGSFISFESDEVVTVEIVANEKVNSVEVKPKRYNIDPVVEGKKVIFEMPAESKLMIEINNPVAQGGEQLFIYSNKIVTDKPDPDNPKVHYFKSGQVYEIGEIKLQDDEMVYIEGGAVVRGNILATHAKNIKIAGLGVIDGSYYQGYKYHPKTILTEDCDDVTIEGIIMIEPQAWTLMLYYTENVVIDNLKQITTGHGSDGIDIVSSRNIKINNSILSNGDDCIVLKAFKRDEYATPKNNSIEGVQNVLVTNCAVQANLGGQAFEIGHELLFGPISNVTFRDCDVLGVHGQGGVFGIHNSDDAHIENVLYENIRVDHFYNKLVDLRIIKSRWTDAEDRGSAENITLKDIDVAVSMYNPGYSISLIGGYDEDHKIKNVTFDNFRLNGEKVTNADQLDLFIKQAEDIKFK
jgi:hypothetical protein